MDLLHTNTVAINYPCLLHRKTLKQYHWKLLSSISFPFCLPVHLWVTHNHFMGVKHGTVCTAVLLLVTHRFCHSAACMTVHCSSTSQASIHLWFQHTGHPLQEFMFIKGLHYTTLLHTTCFKINPASCRVFNIIPVQKDFLEGTSDYAHVWWFSHDIVKSRQCGRLWWDGGVAGTRSSQILWQYYLDELQLQRVDVASLIISFQAPCYKSKPVPNFMYAVYRIWQDFLQCKQVEWFHESDDKMIKHIVSSQVSLP
jgi:hypothetical protein